MNEIWKQIAAQQGWDIINITQVHGGDINQAFCVETATRKFFIKLNDAGKYPQMFQREANGLVRLQQHFLLKVPDVMGVGETGSQQYLVLEWLEPANANKYSWQAFGHALAQMHKATHPFFGWEEETYIASITQTNDWSPNWPAFYTKQRIIPLVNRLQDDRVFTEKDVLQAQSFCNGLEKRLPEEPPALLHGDLWSGNVMAISVNNQITTAIYDPDVFYGHREVDIAMTKLFGGFPPEFYEAYHETYPLQPGWLHRLPLFQLYPLLVHAVLFGSGYVGRVKAIINS